MVSVTEEGGVEEEEEEEVELGVLGELDSMLEREERRGEEEAQLIYREILEVVQANSASSLATHRSDSAPVLHFALAAGANGNLFQGQNGWLWTPGRICSW